MKWSEFESCQRDNITFCVKDVIKAMEIALKTYGNIPVKSNGFFGNSDKEPINFLIYSNKENSLRLSDYRDKETANFFIRDDEEIVYGIEQEESADEIGQ